jgi:hypothetical protein
VNPALLSALVAAVETLAQIVPTISNAVKVLQSGNATQADVDAATDAMDQAVNAWLNRTPNA